MLRPKSPGGQSAAPPTPPPPQGGQGWRGRGVTGASGDGAGRRRREVTPETEVAQMAALSPTRDEPRGN